MIETDQLALLPLWYAVFLLSLTCHEAAHAFVAWRGGDPTAYHAGQVSLNPLPHVRREPWGTVLIPLFTYLSSGWMMGWASAPYDPWWGSRHPRRAALMALAGPAANLALAAIAFAVLRMGLLGGVWQQPDVATFDRFVEVVPGAAAALDGTGRLLSILLALNLLLCVFNLVPLPPLDGASVVSGFSRTAAALRERWERSPLSSLVGLLVAMLVVSPIFRPIARLVLEQLYR